MISKWAKDYAQVYSNDLAVTISNIGLVTNLVQEYPCVVNGQKFVLIDTPGFDDTDVDDEEIFEQLADYLFQSYEDDKRLSALLYLHRISSNRTKGSDLRNLRMIQKLCGAENFSKVMIGITFWDKEDPEIARFREKSLRQSSDFWGGMIMGEAKVQRIPFLDKDGCIKLLEDISCHGTKLTLRIQDEMAVQKLSAKQTSAATEMVHYKQMQAIADSEKLEQVAQKARHDEELLRQRLHHYQQQKEQLRVAEEADNDHIKKLERLIEEKKNELAAETKRAEARREVIDGLESQMRSFALQEQRLQQQQDQARLDQQHSANKLVRAEIRARVEPHAKHMKSDLELCDIYLSNPVKRQSASIKGSELRQGFCDLCMAHAPFLKPSWSMSIPSF